MDAMKKKNNGAMHKSIVHLKRRMERTKNTNKNRLTETFTARLLAEQFWMAIKFLNDKSLCKAW
jgi:hypothetical protein